MKSTCPLSKSFCILLFVSILLATDFSFSQKRGKAPRRSESRAAVLVDEADKLADERKWSEATDAYKLAIRVDPNYAPAHGGLGHAYLNAGNPEQALVAFKEQARLAPNEAEAQFDLGYYYNFMGRHGEAFAPLVKASQLDPTFAEAFYEIGFAYLRGEDFNKSIGFFRSAIRLKPDYAEAHLGLGQVYAKQGKAELANEQLRKLNTVDPKLARKLEKEMQSVATATATASSQAPSTEMTSAPAQAPVTEPAATQTQQPATAPAATELTSRQLQQVPSAPPQDTTTSAPAAQTGQINSLPIGPKRWALVIGVDKYQDPQISSLKGSDNDARLIADALVRYAGFPRDQVILLSTDQPLERQPTRVNILRRLSNLSTAVPKDGLLLVSFAGHGMERGGQAFLLPSDAQISDQISFLEETAISTNRVKDRIKETGVSQVVLLLDACRNDPGGRAEAPNPLTNAYTNAFNFDVRNREVQAFATIYATGIGQRAYEYTEKKQGYFSWALVEGLKGAAANEKGEVTLSQLVRFVQDTVPKRLAIDLGSTKQQKPFAVIEGYRADELVVAVTNSATMANNASTPNMQTVDPAALELSFWDTIKNSNNPDDFKAYLDKYPDGQFAALARSRSQATRTMGNTGGGDSMEMVYWNAIKDSRNPSDFRGYVTKFPGSLFADLANSRLSALEAEDRERAAAKERSIGDTTWVGKIKTKALTYGTDLKIEFLSGGVFAGAYQDLGNGEKRELTAVNLSGTWTQDGNTLVVQLLQPQPGVMRLAIAGNKIEGAIQGTDKFAVQRILTKPMSSQPCDLRGFTVKISYRVKDKIDRTAEANKIAERLRGYGMDVKVEQYNEKLWPTGLRSFNGQGNIANLVIECLKDVSLLQPTDAGNSSTGVNHFNIWLQK
jgi:tetratricopeptide (TPR) repeat protein